MQNLLDLKKLGMQQGGPGKHFMTQTRWSLFNSGSASTQGGLINSGNTSLTGQH